MPRNSAGTYSQPASDVNPPISSTPIDPIAFAAAITDLGSELTNSVDRLGRGAMQAPLAMGGNNIVNAGAPVAQADVARLADIASYLPAGIWLPWCGLAAPAGWLLCDGTAYLITTYPALAAALGTRGTDGVSWGQTGAPASGFFHVPDFRGAFIRGLDSGKGLDPARVIGTYQADMFAAHTHVQNIHTHTDAGHQHTYNAAAGAAIAGPGSNFVETSSNLQNTGVGFAALAGTTAVNQNTGGAETAPKNMSAPFIIRT